MTLSLYQVILGLAALVSIVALAVMRIVNADAAVGVIFTILGYAFGVAVPSRSSNGNGSMFRQPAAPDPSVTVINQPAPAPEQ